jgi:hypothetical protein
MDRVILPCFNPEGELTYWQGRSVSSKPKYLNAESERGSRWFVNTGINPNTLVIVEDILSAIKVGRQFDSIALLGSFIPTKLLDYFSKYAIIVLWLDEDKKATAIKFAHKFRQLSGKPVHVVSTRLDPKALSDEEIYNTIYDRIKYS